MRHGPSRAKCLTWNRERKRLRSFTEVCQVNANNEVRLMGHFRPGRCLETPGTSSVELIICGSTSNTILSSRKIHDRRMDI
ncbi:hypothetical protein E2C01_006722 [Portunus trituberculatus]|uniref:Uncharacterized protein n=1 Tax=Portunus trituberculatus TaxID=210409 RepID=A0A5B7CX32_PORTR|nr:hypothetical protein [Portunus trituberculatus]